MSRQYAIPDRRDLEKKYKAKLSIFEKILNKLQEELKRELAALDLHPTIKSRVKNFDSYYKKILYLLAKPENQNDLLVIYDVLGLRIVCPFLGDLRIVENHIKHKYHVAQVELKGSDHSFREFGYKSIHFLINVPEKLLHQCKVEEPLFCEIQLRTILQDAWSEVEHELIYKKDFSPFDEPMKCKLAALNANLTLSDTLFQEIRDYQQKLKLELNKRREDLMLKVQKPAAASTLTIKSDNYMSCCGPQEDTYDTGDKSVDDLLVDALTAHNTGQFMLAITIYTSILTRDFPEHIRSIIHVHRGMAYFAYSSYEKALEDFTRSLQLDPDNHRALYFRGLTQQIRHSYRDALADFSACLAINPYQFQPLYSRAQIYGLLGDYTHALADCRQALKIEPESSEAKELEKSLKKLSPTVPCTTDDVSVRKKGLKKD